MELEGGSNGGNQHQHHLFADDFDSTCSTPYLSAPSSPGRGPGFASGFYFSAPASPMHYVLSSAPYSVAGSPSSSPPATLSGSNSIEFEFSSEFPSIGAVATGSMSSADELFHNGKIRPMKLSSHLQRPQALVPLVDVDVEEGDEEGAVKTEARGRDNLRMSRSLHRRARSMSPLRNSRFQWRDDEGDKGKGKEIIDLELEMEVDLDAKQTEEAATTASGSASSSRSSSSGRNSKRWIFLKDLLYRSKSEGRGTSSSKEKFWHNLSFSPSASKAKPPPSGDAPPRKHKAPAAAPAAPTCSSSKKKPTNGLGKRRGPAPSAHERHYTANRAAAEELRKRTFLPYRQGLLGCLGFSSRGYGAVNGIARALNPVSSSTVDANGGWWPRVI